jgi:hypothetical protein
MKMRHARIQFFLLALTVMSTRLAEAQSLVVESLISEPELGPIGLLPVDSTEVTPVIASDGTVAFLSKPVGAVPAKFHVLTAQGPRVRSLPSSYTNVRSLRINAGQVVFVADRTTVPARRGVYRIDVAGLIAGTTTIRKVFDMVKPSSSSDPYLKQFVSLSPNGTLAFSTVVNGNGSVYRFPILGSVSAFQSKPQTGSPLIFNSREIEVNDAGQVAIEAEYNDPSAGLCRGVLIFDQPDETAVTAQAAVSRLTVGSHAYFRLGNNNKVALYFSTNASAPSLNHTVNAGFYLANVTGIGVVPNSTLITTVGATGTFTTVRGWDFDGQSVLTISGNRQSPTASGIFTSKNGAAPSTAPFIKVGDLISGRRISFIRAGQLNSVGKLAIFISDFNSGDRFIWRVSGF